LLQQSHWFTHPLDHYSYSTHKGFCFLTSRYYIVDANSATQDWLLSANSELRPSNFSRWSFLYSISRNCTENTASNSSSIVACEFTAMETHLPHHCLTMAVSSCSTTPAFNHRVRLLILSTLRAYSHVFSPRGHACVICDHLQEWTSISYRPHCFCF
jgi:hypothetical protein